MKRATRIFLLFFLLQQLSTVAQPEINCNQIHTAAETSAYVLPYPIGKTYKVTQSYCHPFGGHKNTFAYDFNMQIGDTIVASRAGTVTFANDQYFDTDNVSGHENNVFIRHSDGTIIRYTHLKFGGALVQAGNIIVQGQPIGLAGSSGNTGGVPHLHFQGFRDGTSYNRQNSIPINFSNATGMLNEQNLLIEGQFYTAQSSVTTSTEDIHAEQLFVVSPNPVYHELNINRNEAVFVNQIRVFSLAGNIIFQQKINAVQANFNIQLPKLATGLYILVILTNAGTSIHKINYQQR